MKNLSLKAVCVITAVIGLSLLLGSGSVCAAEAQKALVDLNTASQKDLETLKGVGPATAKKIISSRPYASTSELSKAGLSAKTIEELKPFVTVGAQKVSPPTTPGKTPAATATPGKTPAPATPVATPQKAAPASGAEAKKAPAAAKLAPGQVMNINTANKEQLALLPEIGEKKAQAIIDGRPYKTKEDIMKVKGIKTGIFNKIKDSITVQ